MGAPEQVSPHGWRWNNDKPEKVDLTCGLIRSIYTRDVEIKALRDEVKELKELLAGEVDTNIDLREQLLQKTDEIERLTGACIPELQRLLGTAIRERDEAKQKLEEEVTKAWATSMVTS